MGEKNDSTIKTEKSFKDIVWNEWYRYMLKARNRDERKQINKVFIDITEKINEAYAELEGTIPPRKPEPWEHILRYIPPPLPFDPIGMMIYKNITKPRKSKGKSTCELCAMMSLEDFLEDNICNNAKGRDMCAVDFLKEIYFYVAGITVPDEFKNKLEKVFKKHDLDPNKMVNLKI
jgi:hypothetical protein